MLAMEFLKCVEYNRCIAADVESALNTRTFVHFHSVTYMCSIGCQL